MIRHVENASVFQKFMRHTNPTYVQWNPFGAGYLQPSSDFAANKSRHEHVMKYKSKFIPALIDIRHVMFFRPRRFGKSLALSMLKYFFYGATNLFKDTDVFQMDFNAAGKFKWCPSEYSKHARHRAHHPIRSCDLLDAEDRVGLGLLPNSHPQTQSSCQQSE